MPLLFVLTKLYSGTDLFFSAGVGFAVGFFHSFGADVGIDLSGTQVSVTEHFLHAAQIGSRIEQMGGKTVAQFVGRKIRRQSCRIQVIFQIALKTPRSEPSAVAVDEYRCGRTVIG